MADLLQDGVQAAANALSIAWGKYVSAFEYDPRGTPKQLAALIELAGGEDFLIRLGRATEVAKMARGMRAVAKKPLRRRSKSRQT